MKKRRFLIDVDEVLGDFHTPAELAVSRVLGRPWTIEESTGLWDMFEGLPEEVYREVRKILEAPGFCSAIKPKDGAKEAVKELQKLTELHVVTSPLRSRNWVVEREQWLADHFDIQRQYVHHSASKYPYSGSWFLDDKPDHVLQWQEENPRGDGMLWTTRINTRAGLDHIRVGTWSEVISRVLETIWNEDI